MKKIREYNQPIMRLKACYRCLKWFHDLEKPKKIQKLYSAKIGADLAIAVNLIEIKSLVSCLSVATTDNENRFFASLEELETEIRSACKNARPIRLGFVARALTDLTELKNKGWPNISNGCTSCWSQFGFSAIAAWNF